MKVMALAKSYYPGLLTRGFPQYKADGSQYGVKDFGRIDKETRLSACQIAEKLKIKELHHGFKPNGERRDHFNPRNITVVRCSEQQSRVTKQTQSTSNPSSITTVIAAPAHPLFEGHRVICCLLAHRHLFPPLLSVMGPLFLSTVSVKPKSNLQSSLYFFVTFL